MDINVYKPTYSESRAAFLASVTQAAGVVTSHKNPNAVGPNGEDLYCDVACFGEANAKRLLLTTSGTHGIEGGVGSAIFVTALQNGLFDDCLADTKVVLVHSINPWGHAFFSRCTENNVDLNRNFITHGDGYVSKPDYLKMHGVCTPTEWNDEAFAQFMDAYRAMASTSGEAAVINAIFGGQYDRQDGLNFGGCQVEWSNQLMRNIVAEHKAGVEKVAFIDWHTGLGEYGKRLFFCLDNPTSDSYRRMHQWYGDEFLDFTQAFTGGKIPNYSGMLMNAVADEFERVEGVDICKLVVEFGTQSNEEIFRAFLIDRWIRFEGRHDQEKVTALRADIMECYCPEDKIWRAAVLEQSQEIIQLSLSGLACW